MLRSAGVAGGYSQQPPQPPRTLSYREQKAAKSNRSEDERLQTRLKAMEREREHKRHVGTVERRLVLRQVEEIHRTTGYSPLGVRPDRGDQALRESAYFTSGRKLSERALGRWKLHEASAERELRLTGAEVRRRQDQQDALNRLLLELGVIERRRPTLSTAASSSSSLVAASGRRRFGRSHSMPPVAVAATESGSGDSRWQARAAARAEAVAASAAVAAEAPPSNSRLVRADAVAALNRLADKQSRMFNKRGELLRKAKIISAASRHVDTDASDSDANNNSEEEEEPAAAAALDAAEKDLGTVGPQWMRQLKCEAPPGVHEPRRQKARVLLTVSRTSLKQQLRDMVARQNQQVELRLPAMLVVRRSATE